MLSQRTGVQAATNEPSQQSTLLTCTYSIIKTLPLQSPGTDRGTTIGGFARLPSTVWATPAAIFSMACASARKSSSLSKTRSNSQKTCAVW